MEKSRGGLGIKKHRTSGKSGKSPKMREYLKREAEKNEKKPKRASLMYSKISDIPTR